MIMEPLKGVALVVDDEEGIREVLIDYLEELGLEVEEAESGVVALEKVKTRKYDYICTDYEMPGMSGEEFIQEAKKLSNGDTRFYIVTGYVEVKNEDNSKLTCDGYIQKPFTEETIYKAFQSVDNNEKISA
jgi:two-component system, chemotaxis family, chemotaxis protein CheY